MGRTRERLQRDAATDRYIAAGELEVFRQIRRDANAIDAMPPDRLELAVGPFARLRADAVVEVVGKTRGAINNVWGNQETFRAAVMEGFLNDTGMGVVDVEYPRPEACSDLEEWIDALARTEIGRGPRHGMEPENRYGLRWSAWLGLVPYGIWSDRVAGPSLDEHRTDVARYATEIVGPALAHFDRTLVEDTTAEQLAASMISVVEGTWLNACLTDADPVSGTGSIATTLATALRLLMRGATQPITQPARRRRR